MYIFITNYSSFHVHVLKPTPNKRNMTLQYAPNSEALCAFIKTLHTLITEGLMKPDPQTLVTLICISKEE